MDLFSIILNQPRLLLAASISGYENVGQQTELMAPESDFEYG